MSQGLPQSGYLAYATVLWASTTVWMLSQALDRDQSEPAETYTLEDAVTYQWEYLRQCMSELEALTG